MNFITYEKAYCLYPRETIDKSISLVLKEYTTESYMAIKKYNLRGFKFYDVVDEDEGDFGILSDIEEEEESDYSSSSEEE